MGTVTISRELKKVGVKTLYDNDRFCEATLVYMLCNEIYKGDKLIQKNAPQNMYTKKPDESVSYKSYYIEDDHEPIVSKELWQKVQDILDSYSKHKTQGSYFLKGKVYCGECGCPMRRISYQYHYVRQKVWQCEGRFKGKKGNGCKNEIIGFIEKESPLLTDAHGVILKPLIVSPCTSDVHTIWQGSPKKENLTLGHECVAKVIQVGADVHDFRAGDVVAVPAITPDWSQEDVEKNPSHAGTA